MVSPRAEVRFYAYSSLAVRNSVNFLCDNYLLVPISQVEQIMGVIVMCSVGGGDFNLEVEGLELERYKCNSCGNKFDGMGEEVVCPSCQSGNVVKI